MTEILGDHRLTQIVAAHQDEIPRLAKKVECQRSLDDVSFDLRGPGPIEISHGFEALHPAETHAPFQAAARTFRGPRAISSSSCRETNGPWWRGRENHPVVVERRTNRSDGVAPVGYSSSSPDSPSLLLNRAS